MKQCSRCRIEQSVNNFVKDKSHSDGRRSACRACTNVRPIREPLAKGQKRCADCERILDVKSFSKAAQALDGLQHACRTCQAVRRAEYYAKNRKRDNSRRVAAHDSAAQRERSLRKRYGIGQAEYDTLLISQGGHCAICPAVPGARPLHIDHCHSTGIIRGLLCPKCNTVAGYIEDQDLVEAVKRYLQLAS